MPAPRPVRCRFANTAAATPSSISAIASSLVLSCVTREASWRPATRTTHSRRSATPYSLSKTPQVAESAPMWRPPPARSPCPAPSRPASAGSPTHVGGFKPHVGGSKPHVGSSKPDVGRFRTHVGQLEGRVGRFERHLRPSSTGIRRFGNPCRPVIDPCPPVRQPTSATGRPTSAGLPTHVGNWSTRIRRPDGTAPRSGGQSCAGRPR